jgi:hypothetical protein
MIWTVTIHLTADSVYFTLYTNAYSPVVHTPDIAIRVQHEVI